MKKSNYFKATDAAELKTEYRRLSFQLHPDRGGSAADFAQMKAEYTERLANIEQSEQKAETIANVASSIYDILSVLRPDMAKQVQRIAQSEDVRKIVQSVNPEFINILNNINSK